MPIYEYSCKKCGKITDFLEGVGSAEAEQKCRFCGSDDLEKIMSVSHVSLGSSSIGSQGGKTCCGRTERCEKPPCSDKGVCER